MLLSMIYLVLTLPVLTLITQPYRISLIPDTFAISSSLSPSFVRQEIIDAPDDWQFWKGSSNVSPIRAHDGHSIQIENANNITQCKIGDKFISPDIQSVSYISNGKTLNATVWLKSNFEEPPLKDNIDIFPEQLKIKVSNLTAASSNISVERYAKIQIAKMYNPLNIVNNFTIDKNVNSTTNIGGSPAYKTVYTAKNEEGIDLKNMTLWTLNKNRVYDITFSASRIDYPNYLPAIQKIIDSLKFESSYAANISNTKPSNRQGNAVDDGVLKFEGLGIKIDYPLDWQKIQEITDGGNSRTVMFRSPYEDGTLDRPSWHEITFTKAIAIDSVQHAGVTDYRVVLSRNPTDSSDESNNKNTSNYNNQNSTWVWTKQITEVSAYDKSRVLEEEKNYTGSSDINRPYILFSFDLEKVNFPQQYRAVFYITDYFVKEHHFCRLIDTTNWVIIPPPEFTMSTTLGSVVLRPGEEKDVELTIKGNTRLPSEAILTDSNTNNNNSSDNSIRISFVPNKVSIPSSSVGTSTLHVKALDDSKPVSYTLPIIANISFPTKITNRGGEVFSNSKSISLTQASNLTLTVLPPFTTQELLSNFVNAWITPITGVWTFLAGIGAVIAPLIISIYRKRQKRNNSDKKVN
jgi:hypothetical protein